MSDISVKVSKDLSDILGLEGGEDIQKESRLLIALELYREGRISAGKTAEIADLPFDEFFEELKKRKMRLYTTLNIDELEEEESKAEKYLR